MDSEQRQRIADALCEEWEQAHGDLESNALHERLLRDGEQLSNDALLDFLDELEEADLISQTKNIGSRRIRDVNPLLWDEPLNY